MEIFKLNDEIIENNSSVNSTKLKITNIKPAVKNENRVNVFVNEKYAFSLDVSQVVDFKIKVGQEITTEKLAEYKKASEFGKLYQRALEWILIRPRSIREVKDYLREKTRKSSSDTLVPARRYGRDFANSLPVGRAVSSEDISSFHQTIIERLILHGYLDDRRFAEYYVENRFVKKGVSRKRLRMELIKKGVEANVIDEVLDVRDDEAEIKKMIERKRARYDDDKLIQYLCRQGFSYEMARNLVLTYGKD